MSDYTIESTELVPLMNPWDDQEEAQRILEYSESDIPVKFVLITTNSSVLKLIVFTYHRSFEHADIAHRYVWMWDNQYFGAGKINHIKARYGKAVWDSYSCERKYGRDTPEIDPEEWDAILRQVKQRALECLTQIASGKTSS
jgi:hypothetical protein